MDVCTLKLDLRVGTLISYVLLMFHSQSVVCGANTTNNVSPSFYFRAHCENYIFNQKKTHSRINCACFSIFFFLSLTGCICHSSTSSAGDVGSLQTISFPKEDGTVTDREPRDWQLSFVCVRAGEYSR